MMVDDACHLELTMEKYWPQNFDERNTLARGMLACWNETRSNDAKFGSHLANVSLLINPTWKIPSYNLKVDPLTLGLRH